MQNRAISQGYDNLWLRKEGDRIVTLPSITYQSDDDVDLEEFIDLFVDSTLALRRPADDPDRMRRMLAEADLIVTARYGDRLVGISRSVTDWVYCTYLSDLAVRLDYQGQGIGRELVRLTREATPQATVVLLAAPKAADYYSKIGMERHHSAWVLPPGQSVI